MKTRVLLLSAFFLMFLWSCEKENVDVPVDKQKGSFQMNITDARCEQDGNKSVKTDTNDIIDPEKLTKFEVTFSDISIRDSANNLIPIISTSLSIDLRVFRGTVKELIPIEITLGTYNAIVLRISGVNIVYDNNTYIASTTQQAQVTIGSVSQTISSGIPNPFTTELTYELPFEFQIGDTTNINSVRLFFDVETACKEIAFDAPYIGTVLFAGIRDDFNIDAIFEQNIQQIKHSPPLGIVIETPNDIAYYGIHTFIDFDEKGGTINSHTSQHVFRGDDGSLKIDVETMEINSTPLSPNTVNSTGETDIRADEVFKYVDIKNNLASKGYDLESGKTYYFSLRKTWNITTDGQTYEITRLCEPIPVTCP
ncbi:MAG: hypothetical protein JXL97_02205 [Bacteroidales bacterium]|nr:hypothetical protein [Bacteroidales bacterium]